MGWLVLELGWLVRQCYSPDLVVNSLVLSLSQMSLSGAPEKLGLMASISCSWKGRNWRIFSKLHTFSSDWKSSATVRFTSDSGAGPIVLVWEEELSHGSSQTLRFMPFPTAHPELFEMIFLPSMIPLQPWEHAEGIGAERKESDEQYLPKRILASRLLGYLTIRQLNLVRKASLILSISRKSSPPWSFGRVIVSHAIHDIFRFLSRSSHQKRVRADWILL